MPWQLFGFEHEARPQHVVSQHVFDVYCQHEGWYWEKWASKYSLPPMDDEYWAYAEEILNCAGNGSLLEV
eukprot:3466249-Prorocentrum_lima.AAC.1